MKKISGNKQKYCIALVAAIALSSCTTESTVRRESIQMNSAFTQVGTYRLMQGNTPISPTSLYLKATQNGTQWKLELAKQPLKWDGRNEELFAINTERKLIKPIFEKVINGTKGDIPTPSEFLSCSLLLGISRKNAYTVCTSSFATGDGQVNWTQMAAMLINANAPDLIDQRVVEIATVAAQEKANAEAFQRAEIAAKRKAELARLEEANRVQNEYKKRSIAKLKTLPVGSSIECNVLGTTVTCPELIGLESNEFSSAGPWRVTFVGESANGVGSRQIFKKLP